MKLQNDNLIRNCLRPLRGAATDEQYQDAYQRIEDALGGILPRLPDCIFIIQTEAKRLCDAMRAKGYAKSNVSIDAHSDGYFFVKLDTKKEAVFGGYTFNWLCKRDFDEALTRAEVAIEAMPINYPAEAYAPWFTVEPAQSEAAQ